MAHANAYLGSVDERVSVGSSLVLRAVRQAGIRPRASERRRLQAWRPGRAAHCRRGARLRCGAHELSHLRVLNRLDGILSLDDLAPECTGFP